MFTLSVTASNYPKQTQRCITVTNDFKTGLATNAKSQKEGLWNKKSDDKWLLQHEYSLSGSVLSYVTSLLVHL